jgi:5-formyltetrahydrofolate cyclo-ligase
VDETVSARKARRRQELRERRRAMDEDTRRERAGRLWGNALAELAEQGRLEPGSPVMAFHGFDDEPPTEALFEGVWAAGAELVLPRVEGDHLVPVTHRRGEPLVASSFGVPEPTGAAIDARGLPTVVVPGLAFDRDGRRLGYGVGYYDRFLADVGPDSLVIGACLHPQLVDELPTAGHDVGVDLVVTDREIVRPRR